MRISLIAAAARNGVIGADGALPWHLPNDFRHFRDTTMGSPVIMGRKTFESIGRALPGRLNIVMTRDDEARYEGCITAASAEEALEAAGDTAEAFVIGGGEIYAIFLDRAARIYLTVVDTEISGDVRFPEIDPAKWRQVSAVSHPADDRHAFTYEFRVYDRR